jgi:hypothetical protein
MHLYNEGEYIRTKEARSEKEFNQMVLNGYIIKPETTEFPKMLYKRVGGVTKEKIVADKNAEAEARKAGFTENYKLTASEDAATTTTTTGKGNEKTAKK